MNVTCPECASEVDGEPGTEMVCPACMSMFTPPIRAQSRSAQDVPAERAESRPRGRRSDPRRSLRPTPAASRSWEIQLVDGTVQRGLSRFSIREQVYLGQLPNTSRVRRNDGEWEAIGKVAEFAHIFQILGVEPLPGPINRKIAGWKADAVAEPPPKVARAALAPPSVASSGTRASTRGSSAPALFAPETNTAKTWLAAALLLVAGLVLVIVFVL